MIVGTPFVALLCVFACEPSHLQLLGSLAGPQISQGCGWRHRLQCNSLGYDPQLLDVAASRMHIPPRSCVRMPPLTPSAPPPSMQPASSLWRVECRTVCLCAQL